MRIQSVTLQNVKSFRDSTRFEFGPGVNFLVGDNNSGKSTVMQALLFLFEGPSANRWVPDSFYSSGADQPTRVEVEIVGDLDALVAKDMFKVLASFVFDDGGQRVLRLERSSEVRSVVQNGKSKQVDVKAVCFWHPDRSQFENVTGIDAKVKAIFDFEAIWADASPGDHIDFATTKTLGRLLDATFKKFTTSARWLALEKAHAEAFSKDGEDSFLVETRQLASDLKKLVDEQYGLADYRFEFALPDAAIFMKQGQLHVDDGAGETPIIGKGTGMQRAVALGVIQLYARSASQLAEKNETPLVLILDEPETWLHPAAQLRLGDALSQIGVEEQVFIITHSPYLIRKFDTASHLLTVISGNGATREIHSSTHFGLFGTGEPTWGEINFRAFGICSNDFHNELYGHIQWHIESVVNPGSPAREKDIDNFLVDKGVDVSKTWKRTSGASYLSTLPVYVRNSIHHPENNENPAVSEAELLESTRALIAIVEGLVWGEPGS